MDQILRYFPELNTLQIKQFQALFQLYNDWNEKINVISRKDMDSLYEKHILHSLGIAKVMEFAPNTKVLDIGTGGGFPGIPLAMMFPDVQFTLVDSIGKKIKVVEAIAKSLELHNVISLNARFESVKQKFDFITGRAVASLPIFLSQVRSGLKRAGVNDLPNGILYLTGGEIEPDLQQMNALATVYNLADNISEEYFITKKLVHLYNF